MARLDKQREKGSGQQLLGMFDPRTPFRAMKAQADSTGLPDKTAPLTPQPLDPGDPTGIKSYIALSVAHGVYPKGPGIDPDQNIEDDVKLNAVKVATEVNVDAQHSATLHQLIWNPVTTTQIGSLKTVGDLVELVKGNLSDPTAAGKQK